MSKNRHVSETPSTQLLRQRKVAFTEHTYDYVDHGGAGEAARQLGLDPHAVVKTLIMEDEGGHPLLVLMHGDREVSTKNLARQAGLKKVAPCQPEVAQRHFDQAGKPIAAVCHGAQLLAAAGILKGRTCSAYPACAPEVRLAGGTYAEIGIDQAHTDGNLVTAPAWPAHPAWLAQFLAVLGTRISH
nr:DJ-1/PfpI family protein [Bordetella parapertussis]